MYDCKGLQMYYIANLYYPMLMLSQSLGFGNFEKMFIINISVLCYLNLNASHFLTVYLFASINKDIL